MYTTINATRLPRHARSAYSGYQSSSRCFRVTIGLTLQMRRAIQTKARRENFIHEDVDNDEYFPPTAGLATPRQLVRYLNDYVVGQENAKKVLSVAVFNHYNRVRANLSILDEAEEEHDWSEIDSTDVNVSAAHIQPHPYRSTFSSPSINSRHHQLFEKSNVLVVGPTGSGKTLLARTLAKVLDVPFSVSDATSFTQAGYVGEDVDMCIQRLFQAASYDPNRASTGIVYIDEIDKLARKAGGGSEGTRDVGGEGVQQALLRMMEGTVVSVSTKGAGSAGGLDPPSMNMADGRPRGSRGPGVGAPQPKPETYHIDTSNILFIVSGAFVGLDNLVKRRVSKGSIGFTAPLASSEDSTHSDSKGLPFFTPNKHRQSNVLDLLEPADLVKYGFIPEFISRLPSITTLAPLSVTDLRRILTEVKGSLISQYQALFEYSHAELRFTDAALDEICIKAFERGGGARGLRGIMETLLLDAMYEVPGSNTRHVLITRDVVRGQKKAMYWPRGGAGALWEVWSTEQTFHDNSDK